MIGVQYEQHIHGPSKNRINREVVASSKQAVDLSEKVKKDKKVLLRVSSKGASRFVVIAPKE